MRRRYSLWCLLFFFSVSVSCDGGGTSGTGVVTTDVSAGSAESMCGVVTDAHGKAIGEAMVESLFSGEKTITDQGGAFHLSQRPLAGLVVTDDVGAHEVVIVVQGREIQSAESAEVNVTMEPCVEEDVQEQGKKLELNGDSLQEKEEHMKGSKGLLLILGLLACGGGGGSSEGKFAGVWSGTVSLVEDNCAVVDPSYPYVSFTHLVNVDGEKVILDNGVAVFEGEREGENGFSARLTRAHEPLFEGASCTEEILWRYEEVKRDTAQFVVRNSTITCSRGAEIQSCSFGFSGSAYKYSGGGGGPIVFDNVGGEAVPDDANASTIAESSL